MSSNQPHSIVLNQLKDLLSKLSPEQLSHKGNLLYNASIGEHIRHIIEFYRCCIFYSKKGIVNYDLRQREKLLENDPLACIAAIEQIQNHLEKGSIQNVSLQLKLECISDPNGVPTNLERELIFCLDHCIHHQGIIKIGLKEMGLDSLIGKDFGVAFSTQTYREKCAS